MGDGDRQGYGKHEGMVISNINPLHRLTRPCGGWFALLMFSVVIFGQPSRAQTADTTSRPWDRSADQIIALLEEFLRADFIDPAPIQTGLVKKIRLPRHALFHSIILMQKVERLKFINGLEPITQLEDSFRVSEGDDALMSRLQTILDDLRELRPIYGSANDLTAGQSPDIHPSRLLLENISYADAMVEALGVAGPVPNDVYRLALMINQGLATILGLPQDRPTSPRTRSTGKIPADSHAKGMAVLTALKVLVDKNPGLNIDGGIQLPKAPKEEITPAHVQYLLGDILADVTAIRAASGKPPAARDPGEQVGKTPGDVFDALEVAFQLAQQLSNGRFTVSKIGEE